jgi:integrative and conjugative element protein (TIGR02256 family)
VRDLRLLAYEGVLGRLLRLPSRPWGVGGWLLGYWSETRDAIVLTHATPPAGRGTPLGVTISGKGHHRRFDQAWQATGGAVTFLGDWHTHPGGPAIPSAKDQKAARQLAEDPDYGTPEPLVAIIANPRWPHSAQHRHARFYVGCKDGCLVEVESIPITRLSPETDMVPEWEWPTLG